MPSEGTTGGVKQMFDIQKIERLTRFKFCPARAVKRTKKSPYKSFDEPFDPERFNFNKVHPDEVLFQLKNVSKSPPEVHNVLINLFPIDKSGGLLVPYPKDNTSQKLTVKSLQVALDFLRLSQSTKLGLFFNSLLGFASVNHQHFQIIYLQKPLPLSFHKERQPLCRGISAVKDWICPAIELTSTCSNLQALVNTVMTVTQCCHERNCAFTLFMASKKIDDVSRSKETTGEAGASTVSVASKRQDDVSKNENNSGEGKGFTVFVMPKKPDKDIDVNPLEMPFYPAAVESNGYFVVADRPTFDTLTEQQAIKFFHKLNPDAEVIKRLYDDIAKSFS